MELSAEINDPDGQKLLGMIYEKEGDYKKALDMYLKSAAQNSQEGQYALGVMYDDGLGVKEDKKEAMKYYELSQTVEAKLKMGIIHFENKNNEESIKCLSYSANKGHPDAQFKLGNMYFDGHGVTRSVKKSFKYYCLSQEQGHVKAHLYLAEMYESGVGTKQDYLKALELYRSGLTLDTGEFKALFETHIGN